MKQTVVNEFPPMYGEIAARFKLKQDDPVIFSWGSKIIYNPTGFTIPPELYAHEAVHGWRQGQKVTEWWKQYLDDPAFRLAEEIPAHQAEYQHLIENGNRQYRRAAMKQVAGRLSSKLYGNMISRGAAKKALKVMP